MSKQNELIEKQIETAANYLDRVGRELSASCFEQLLQIVQNQQNQIEELQKRVSDLEPQTAMGLLEEIVKRGQAGEFYKGEKR